VRRDRVQREELRVVDEGRVRDYWRELDTYMSTGLDRKRKWRELADILARPLSVIFEI